MKIHEMLGFYGEFPAVHPVVKFRGFYVENIKKSALKRSTGCKQLMQMGNV